MNHDGQGNAAPRVTIRVGRGPLALTTAILGAGALAVGIIAPASAAPLQSDKVFVCKYGPGNGGLVLKGGKNPISVKVSSLEEGFDGVFPWTFGDGHDSVAIDWDTGQETPPLSACPLTPPENPPTPDPTETTTTTAEPTETTTTTTEPTETTTTTAEPTETTTTTAVPTETRTTTSAPTQTTTTTTAAPTQEPTTTSVPTETRTTAPVDPVDPADPADPADPVVEPEKAPAKKPVKSSAVNTVPLAATDGAELATAGSWSSFQYLMTGIGSLLLLLSGLLSVRRGSEG